jgi:hypothetical protein
MTGESVFDFSLLHSVWTICYAHAGSYLTDAKKVVGLELNTEKTNCMLLSHRQNAGQSQHI